MILLELMIGLALIATIVALGMGVISMGRGGEYDRQHSEQFMTARISLQAVAVLFLLAAFYLTGA